MEPNKKTNSMIDENNKVEDSTRGRIDNASGSGHQSKKNQIYNESANTQAESVNDLLYQGSDVPIGDSVLQWQNERSSSNSQILQRSETVQNLPARVSNTTAYSLPVSTPHCVEQLDDRLRFPNTDTNLPSTSYELGTSRNNDQVAPVSNSQYATYSTGYCDANDAVNYNEPEVSEHEKVVMHYDKNYPVVSRTTALDKPNQQPKNVTISAIVRDLAESASSFDTYHQSLTPNKYQQSQASSSSQLIANVSNVNCRQEQPTNVPSALVNIFSNESTPFTSPSEASIQQNSDPNNQSSTDTFHSILTNIKLKLEANKQKAARLFSNAYLGNFKGDLNDISHTSKISKNIGNSLRHEADNNQMGQSTQLCATSVMPGNPQQSAQAPARQSDSYSMENFAQNSSHYSQGQSRISKNMPPALIETHSCNSTSFPSPCDSVQQHSTSTIVTIDKRSLAGSHTYDVPANDNSTQMQPTRAASWPESQSSNCNNQAGIVNKVIEAAKRPYSDSNYSMDQLPTVNKKAKFSAGSSPLRFTLVPAVTDKVELASDEVSKTMSKTCLTPCLGNLVVKEGIRSILKEELVDLITNIYKDYKYNALRLYERYITMPLHSTVYRTSTYFHITMDINLFIKEITILIIIINKYIKTYSNQTSSFGEESTRILEIHRIMKSCNFEINSDSLTKENIEKINILDKYMKENNIEGWPKILKCDKATRNERVNNQTVLMQDTSTLQQNPSSKFKNLNLPIESTSSKLDNQPTVQGLHYPSDFDSNYILDEVRNNHIVDSCRNENFIENIDSQVIQNTNSNKNVVPTPSLEFRPTNSQAQRNGDIDDDDVFLEYNGLISQNNLDSLDASQIDRSKVSDSCIYITDCTNSRDVSNISQMNQSKNTDTFDSALGMTNEMSSRDMSDDFQTNRGGRSESPESALDITNVTAPRDVFNISLLIQRELSHQTASNTEITSHQSNFQKN